VDADSFGEDRRWEPCGEDRCWEPCGEREERGVSAFAAALDPVTLQTLLQPVGGHVLPGVPAGYQPPVAPGALKLPVAQRLRDLSEWFGERDLTATEPQRDLAARGGLDVGGSERHDPRGRFSVEEQHAPGEPVPWIEPGVMQQPPLDREALLVADRRARSGTVVPIYVEQAGHLRAPQPREE
jgi:hypothetical protein